MSEPTSGTCSDGTVQARLDVGDTRKPAAIKHYQRVTSGDLAPLAMCAHRYDPAEVRGWYTHEFDDVVRQWICSNVGSVIARLSPHCEDTRGDLPPLHPADDLWVGSVSDRPTQTTLITDGGTCNSSGDRTPFDGCPECSGRLEYQSRSDLICRDCGEEFCHENRGGRHLLWSFDTDYLLDEVVARAE